MSITSAFNTYSRRPYDFDTRDYWPRPAAGDALTISYGLYDAVSAPGTAHTITRYVKEPNGGGLHLGHPAYRKYDYLANAAEIDYWAYYIEENADGSGNVVEYADFDTASGVYVPLSSPIIHGGRGRINEIFECNLRRDASNSVPPQAPASYDNGVNQIWYKELIPTYVNPHGITFNNVLKLRLYQGFCSTNTCQVLGVSSAIVDYWMAPGLAMVGLHYYQPTYPAPNLGQPVIIHATDIRWEPSTNPVVWRAT